MKYLLILVVLWLGCAKTRPVPELHKVFLESIGVEVIIGKAPDYRGAWGCNG